MCGGFFRFLLEDRKAMKACERIRKIGPTGKSLAWAAILLLILARPAAATETATIQISASNLQLRAADTFLDQAAPNTVNGAQQTFAVRSLTGNSNRRAIVMFDLSSLPNVGIKSAILTLHVQTAPSATRTYEAHNVTSFFTEGNATWITRAPGIPWGAAGGDFTAAATSTNTVTNASTTLTFDITADVQTWYNGSPNYGTLIKDSAENNAASVQTVFCSKEAPIQTNAPSLTVTFVQNVASIAVTPGNATATVNWTFPAALGVVVRPNTGVLVLRRQNFPVDKNSWPADGANPALCATLGNGKVVFKNSTLATTFTDNFTCPGDPPPNDSTWFYKVFIHDTLNNYTTNGTSVPNGASTYTMEISATPSATAANQQRSLWIAATHSTNLAAPSLFPASVVMVESQSNLLFGIDANTGLRQYPPVSIAGPITSRSALIDAADTTAGKNVIFIGDQAGLVYAVATDTGQILWVVNPTGLSSNILFQGGASVQLKSLSGGTFAFAHDLVVLGTRIGTTTTANKIFGLDANTGATLWTVTGGSGGVASMDIINSTAEIDYFNGALWLTSHSNGNTQPSLWKINPNTGLVINTANLNDIDSSPSLAPGNDVLFVGSAGTLFAVNPTTLATKSFIGGDGAIVGFPVVVGSSSPYTVIFSGATRVHAVTYTVATGTFAPLWSTLINVPSTPIAITGMPNVFVGSNDGKIHELSLATGADLKQVTANTGQPGFVGDPSLDLTLSRIYVSTTDQRAYAFTFPF
jgi:PQQ-like domain